MSEPRQLSLNFFIYPDGHHEAAWRHSNSVSDRILDVTYYQELAQRAEAHKFDAVFFADGPALAYSATKAALIREQDSDLGTSIEMEALTQALLMKSEDFNEFYNAWHEGRKPDWRGR